MSSLKTDFIQLLKTEYPGLNNKPLEDLVSDNLLSSYQIELPKKILDQAEAAIQAIFKMRESAEYQNSMQDQLNQLGLKDPGNKSIMMSYDFHVDTDGSLKLIEINTNAAFLILGHLLYKLKKITPPVSDFSLDQLKNCMEEELSLQKKIVKNPSVAIIDQNPESQRLYVEFLVAQELFRSWGWKAEIKDVAEALAENPDFIYNRFTDFYFTQPGSAALRESFLKKTVCFSPNPYEYFLLADKKRLTEWSQKKLEPAFAEVLLKSREITDANKEELWAARKSLFFKPSQDFGSKGSFKGSSISRKAFDDLVSKNSLAQNYVPAPEIIFNDGQTFKYDLRFYTYKDRLQTVMARLYQGQTTNLRTPGGGFSCVIFK